MILVFVLVVTIIIDTVIGSMTTIILFTTTLILLIILDNHALEIFAAVFVFILGLVLVSTTVFI